MKITIQLVVEVEDKAHPIRDLVKFIENRTCTIPGVIDANGKEEDSVRQAVPDAATEPAV